MSTIDRLRLKTMRHVLEKRMRRGGKMQCKRQKISKFCLIKFDNHLESSQRIEKLFEKFSLYDNFEGNCKAQRHSFARLMHQPTLLNT